jgi:RNA polymerase sigma factor (sigma-70 family)
VVQDAPVSTEPRDAVERVWREQGPKLWRSMAAFTGDRELATDSMAEAFAQALTRGTEIRDHDRWIWRAAFRIAAGELKHRGSLDRSRPREGGYEMPEPVVDLVRALARLSPNQRAAVVLSDYADLPAREVASILGCRQTTVRVHLSQAHRRLRPLLEERDG